MKRFVLEEADLESCVSRSQKEPVLILRKGKPAALIVGVKGFD